MRRKFKIVIISGDDLDHKDMHNRLRSCFVNTEIELHIVRESPSNNLPVGKIKFEWGYVTHPGIWACGGGRQDLPPVLVGITFQVPQSEPEYAWWCYLGPRPDFENEFDPEDKNKQYIDQVQSTPTKITKNMTASDQWST